MPGKAEIREMALNLRLALGEAERARKSEQIKEEILALHELKIARTVMAYVNFREEVQTTGLLREMLQSGKRVLVPYCLNREMISCRIFNIDSDLRPGKFGIREPLPERLLIVPPAEIDLVLVPGVAFDYQGNRIGYGKGYYDRFLPQLRTQATVAGVAFCCQLFPEIEAEEHDYKMSLLISENSVIYPL